jgi:hypothetical protein
VAAELLFSERKRMRILIVSVIAALGLAGGAAAAGPTSDPPPTPRATTLTLVSFALSPDVQYSSEVFWCSVYDYGAYFANYVGGQCPYQDYVATVHWKKIPQATEYDICVKPVFGDYSPGFACYIAEPAKSGSPAALSMTFDSATMFLNAFQATTQVWMVKACNFDPITHAGSCSESNTVSAEIPWID